MHLWFCPARQWSKRALSFSLLSRPRVALTPLKQQREQREQRRGQLVPAEGGGLERMACGGVWTCPSHGWSDSPCAGLHIWKRSCRCEGGVSGQAALLFCPSSCQRGRGVIFKTHCSETGVAVRLSLIDSKLNSREGNHNLFNFSIEWHESWHERCLGWA